MGILRSDLLTHSQLQPTGSVAFDGTDDYLSIASHSSFAYGTSDFTWEFWVYSDDLSSSIYMLDHGSGDAGMIQYFGNIIRYYNGTTGTGSVLYTGGGSLTESVWHHIAAVRNNGITSLYVDGELRTSGSDSHNYPSAALSIGDYGAHSGNYEWTGNISNVRITRTAVYKTEFTVPKFELKNIAGTVVLCAQSSSSATTAEVTPGTITAAGNATASAFSPDLKKDITDTGVVFDGFGSFATSTYMVPPKGKTTERNRGRGVWGGGTDGTNLATIQYAELSSQGNTIDFGDLITANNTVAAVASATRICFGGGREPSIVNRIQFVEIATTSNATDFGDLTVARTFLDACSNQTRGVFGSGSTPSVNVTIDFITIATTGDATDFGDSTKSSTHSYAACASPTRGIFAGGYQPSSPKFDNVIEYITIASAGNATDFGDMTTGRFNMTPGGCSSTTRGIFGGGKLSSPGTVMNNIDFITIATTGDSTDFGDLTVARQTCGACSNTLRGVFGGGNTAPAKINTIDFIEIATTGNATDFGDMLSVIGDAGASSDSHGGLS